jgi:WXG100 protein secretion system (Wss), protein YukD
MRTVLVTVDSPVRSVDCELPGDVPIRELLPLLVDVCGMSEMNDAGDPSAPSAPFRLWTLGLRASQPLAEIESLIACGIMDGMRLLLRDRESWDAESPSMTAGVQPEDIHPTAETGGIGVRWNRDGLP